MTARPGQDVTMGKSQSRGSQHILLQTTAWAGAGTGSDPGIPVPNPRAPQSAPWPLRPKCQWKLRPALPPRAQGISLVLLSPARCPCSGPASPCPGRGRTPVNPQIFTCSQKTAQLLKQSPYPPCLAVYLFLLLLAVLRKVTSIFPLIFLPSRTNIPPKFLFVSFFFFFLFS